MNKTDFKVLFIFIYVAIPMAHTSAKLSKNPSLCC